MELPIVWGVIIVLFLIVIGLFAGILIRQKELDSPCKGLLIVDRQDIEGPCMVYLQAMVDPGTFKEGEMVKLKVCVVKPDSQGKQG